MPSTPPPAASLFRSLLVLLPALWTGPSAEGQTVRQPFEQTVREMETRFAGRPVRGEVKRWRRAEFWAERHLDADGYPVNPAAANSEALARWAGWTGASGGDWTALGPFNTTTTASNIQEGIGRVNCIAFESATTWYVGTAGGGLWRTENAALWLPGLPYPWECLTDDLPTLAVSGIAVDPLDANNLWILTGDGDAGGYSGGTGSFRVGEVPGVGILRSTDRGATWDTTGFTWNRTQLQAGFKLAVSPWDPGVQFACASDGLHRSTDGWATFTTLISQQVYDVEFHPTDPSIVYAAGEGSFYRSTDGGLNFLNRTTNLVPVGGMQRVAVAVTPANPSLIYLVGARASDGGLATFQLSGDAGDTWIETIDNSFNILAREDPVGTRNGQGNYDLAIWADPVNPLKVLVGGVDLWASLSGGIFWEILADDQEEAPEFIHADVHALERNPFSGWLLAGTDGGIWSSDDGGNAWGKRCQGLAVSQFYHGYLHGHPLFGPIELGGGCQDNGTLASVGLSDHYAHVKGADGFRAYRASPDGDPTRYVSIQNGRLYRQDLFDPDDLFFGLPGEVEITPDEQLDANGNGLGRWDTPFEPNPNNFGELVAGYDALYYNSDGDDEWSRMMLVHPRLAYSGNQTITETRWAPNNPNKLLFSVSDDGGRRDLWSCEAFTLAKVSGDLAFAGCRQVDLDSLTGSSPLVTHILTNPTLSDEVWITFSGYVDSNKVWYNRDIDSSQLWTNISYNLPNVPVHAIDYDVDGVYAGTDIGVFFLQHGESKWVYFSDGLPTVPVMEVHIAESVLFGKRLYVATYGRGMWSSPLAVPQRRTRWYVDDDAAGLDNGSSWTNAFPRLDDALAVALPGDSIWVADGTYRPSAGAGRASSFQTPFANVRIYGGFAGTENTLDARDSSLAQTVLSGDIGVPGDSTDNVYHLWRLSGANGGLLLDRLVLEGGLANGSGIDAQGGAVRFSNALGLQGGKPIFRDVVFRRNGATSDGAAVYVEDVLKNDAPIYFVRCAFENNRCTAGGSRGGAVYATTRSGSATGGSASVEFRDCRFARNSAMFGAGVYLNAQSGGTAHVPFSGCRFEEGWWNPGFGTAGEGIYVDLRFGGSSARLTVDSSRFARQGAIGTGAGIHAILDGGAAMEMTLRQVDFDTLTAASNGGAVFVLADATSRTTFVAEDCRFTGCTGSYGGALALAMGGTGNSARVSRCSFVGNASVGSGGAARFTTLSGASLDLTLDTVLFHANTAAANGGGVVFQFGSGSVTDVALRGATFTDNRANYAGALDALASGATSSWRMEDGHFSGNHSSNSGGAIQANGFGALPMAWTLRRVTFQDNSALGQGGGMALFYADLDAEDVQFSGNGPSTSPVGAPINGGGLYLDYRFADREHAVRLARSVFDGNATNAFGGGGGLHVRVDAPSALHLRLDTVHFQGNTSGFSGGGLSSIANGALTLSGTGSRFTANTSRDGGAMYLQQNGTEPLVVQGQGWTFDANQASWYGGGVYLYADAPTRFRPTGSVWTGNTALLDGGAFHAFPYLGDTAYVELDRAWFTGNTAGRHGGALFAGSKTSTGHTRLNLSNAVVADNEAGADGGALWVGADFGGGSGHAALDFVSAYGNRAGGAGAFAALRDAGTAGQTVLDLRNSLVGASPLDATVALFDAEPASQGSAAYGWIEGGLPPGFTDGGGLWADAPRWVYPENPAGPDGLAANADDGLRPALSSPALDAADPLATAVTDLTGAPRPAGAADAGAYEGGSGACATDWPPTGLDAVPAGSGMQLRWQPLPNSVACQVRGRPLGAPSFANLNAIGGERDALNLPGAALMPGASYEWQVRCACAISPTVLATAFSALDTFTVPLVRTAEAGAWRLQPNPARPGGVLWPSAEGPVDGGDGLWRLSDALGRERAVWRDASERPRLPLPADLAPGVYWVRTPRGDALPLVVQR